MFGPGCHTDILLNTLLTKIKGTLYSIEDLPNEIKESKTKTPEIEIAFSEKDATSIYLYNNDPMVITVRRNDWKIKRVLVDQRSST